MMPPKIHVLADILDRLTAVTQAPTGLLIEALTGIAWDEEEAGNLSHYIERPHPVVVRDQVLEEHPSLPISRRIENYLRQLDDYQRRREGPRLLTDALAEFRRLQAAP